MVVESAGGGTGRHVLDLAEGLAKRGCDVHVAYSPRRADRMFLDRRNSMSDVAFLESPCRTGIHPSDFAATRTLRRYVAERGPFQIVHGHSSKGGALARLAAAGNGAAAFYTLHGLIMMDPGLARWKRLLYLAIELGLSLRTSGIIAVSPEEARAAVRLGLGSRRVITIPNGVDNPDLAPRESVRRELGVSDEELLIGFVGRLVEQKAPHVLIEAFAIASAELRPARLVMVGDGPLRSSLDRLAARLGVADRVMWLGELDARQILAGLDVFALSSRKEGLPYVVLEAMSAGLPVVATSSAGVETLIEPGTTGAVVPRDDVAAFARALIDVALDPVRRRAMGEQSRRLVANFTVDAMVDRTIKAYLERLKP